MYGAILGDIIGSPYEFDANNIKTKDFPLFSERSEYTDDSIMTCAVAEALLSCGEKFDRETLRQALADAMRKYGHRYPFAGYGMNFSMWLERTDIKPCDSCGNSSAVRVSAVPWLFQENLQQTLLVAGVTAEVTHDHPEGIKGAQAVAAVIFMAIHGADKETIRTTISNVFHYDLSRTCDEIRPAYHHVESCQETVPEAIIAFLEGDSFEDVIRSAVSLGGDSDTLTAIAGSMAEAFYGVPEELIREADARLPRDLRQVADDFYKEVKRRRDAIDADPARRARWEQALLPQQTAGGDERGKSASDAGALEKKKKGPDFSTEKLIDPLLEKLAKERNKESVILCLEAVRVSMNAGGSFLTPVRPVSRRNGNGKETASLRFRVADSADGRKWQVAYTGDRAYQRSRSAKEPAVAMTIRRMLEQFLPPKEGDKPSRPGVPAQIAGIVLNPDLKPLFLSRESIGEIFRVDAAKSK